MAVNVSVHLYLPLVLGNSTHCGSFTVQYVYLYFLRYTELHFHFFFLVRREAIEKLDCVVSPCCCLRHATLMLTRVMPGPCLTTYCDKGGKKESICIYKRFCVLSKRVHEIRKQVGYIYKNCMENVYMFQLHVLA